LQYVLNTVFPRQLYLWSEFVYWNGATLASCVTPIIDSPADYHSYYYSSCPCCDNNIFSLVSFLSDLARYSCSDKTVYWQMLIHPHR